jgi:hypothetical protein
VVRVSLNLACRDGAIENLGTQAKRGGVRHTAALAFDLFAVVAAASRPRADEALGRDEVPHPSSPHLSEIPAGRHW